MVEQLGGYAHTSSLLNRGARERDLTRAVRSGAVVRLRRGWYTTRDPASPASRAVSIGGRLTGLSAIAAWGGWILVPPRRLRVSVPANSARLRWSGRARIHWDSLDVTGRGTVTSVGLIDALVRVVLDEILETAVAAIDWALHTGRLDTIDFEQLILRLPANRRWIRHWVDAECESLPESLSRTRLRLAGHKVRSQVPLGSERIDLVVDDLVGLETDGEQFHRDTFEADRRKDLAMIMHRFLPVRAPARMVFHEWEAVLAAIQQLLHTARAPARPAEPR